MNTVNQGILDTGRPEREQRPEEPRALTVRVSPKGAVSVYGLGRFPVTLYKAQWRSLLAEAERLRAFIVEHNDELR